MKYFIILFLNFLLISRLNAQSSDFSSASVVKPYELSITVNKTTILIFPEAIQSADRGAPYILAERMPGAANVLKVKANTANFEPSNLQVVTVDGKVFSFNLNYAKAPDQLTIDLRKQSPYASVNFEGLSLNEQQLTFYAELAACMEPFVKKGMYSKYGLQLYLQGIYLKNDVLFLSYRLHNRTSLAFELESLRFYIRDKKQAKRTAVQDKEVEPVIELYKGNAEDITGQTIVVGFPRFSIADGKYLVAELIEQNGDRNPISKLNQRLLLKARALK